ncbi:MAG: hypothetical protein K2W91_05065 [Novosphingobium sp.]|nr:hypothetical protein [Novosphingobium sp.]
MAEYRARQIARNRRITAWAQDELAALKRARLEVKQSAARQDWHDGEAKPNKGRFDIAARTGRWEGTRWIEVPDRLAAAQPAEAVAYRVAA